MDTKELFYKLLNDNGYSTPYEFCKKNNLDMSNMNKRITGVRQKIEINFMFKIANILKVPVIEVIKVFYPNEIKENEELANK